MIVRRLIAIILAALFLAACNHRQEDPNRYLLPAMLDHLIPGDERPASITKPLIFGSVLPPPPSYNYRVHEPWIAETFPKTCRAIQLRQVVGRIVARASCEDQGNMEVFPAVTAQSTGFLQIGDVRLPVVWHSKESYDAHPCNALALDGARRRFILSRTSNERTWFIVRASGVRVGFGGDILDTCLFDQRKAQSLARLASENDRTSR